MSCALGTFIRGPLPVGWETGGALGGIEIAPGTVTGHRSIFSRSKPAGWCEMKPGTNTKSVTPLPKTR
jgi:hypothetical protein